VYQLSFVPVSYGIFKRDSFGLLEVGAQDGCDFGDCGSLVSIEVAYFDVEVAVVVEAIAGDGRSEGHGCDGESVGR